MGNFVFFPLGGQKHLEKFPNNENRVYRDKEGSRLWDGVGWVAYEILVSAQDPLVLVLGLGLKGLGPGLDKNHWIHDNGNVGGT